MKNRWISASFKKWTLFWRGGLGALALLAGCANPSGSVPGSGSASGPGGLILSLTEAELVVNGPPLQLTASAAVTWSSSDPSVAAVSAAGVVTPVAKGHAVITASDGSATATCTVDSNTLTYWGFTQTAGGPVPVYWLEGVLHTLPVGTGTQTYGVVDSVMRIGADLYFTGYLRDSANTQSTPVYWKNGVLNVLPVPAGYVYAQNWIQPNVDTAGTLYFRGNLLLGGDSKPGMWVGGVWKPMSMALPNGKVATRGEITTECFDSVTGSVYTGGWLWAPGSAMVPVYWTGVPGDVTMVGTGDASSATGVSSFAGLAGVPRIPGIPPVAFMIVSWDPTGLPTPSWYLGGNKTGMSTGSYANAIVWSAFTDARGDRYAFGTAGTAASGPEFWNSAVQSPVYWKNGGLITLPLPSGYTNGVENGAYRDSTGALYFAGQAVNATSAVPVRWFNGAVSPLPTPGYLGGSANGGILAAAD